MTQILLGCIINANHTLYEMENFEVYAEKIIANAGALALTIILFFGIYEVTVIFGFT